MTSIELNSDWVPAECTLPTAEQPLRRSEFADVFASAIGPIEWVSEREIRLVLPKRVQPRTRELAAAESQCCTFFGFTFNEIPDGFAFGITVPPGQERVLVALAAMAQQKGGK